MNKFKIVEKCPVNLYGFTVPIGAMYGYDSKGIWVCTDYRYKKGKYHHAHVMHVLNEYNQFEKVEITPSKCDCNLKLYRLDTKPSDSTYDAGNKWYKSYERGKTVAKIMELYNRFEDKCNVVYKHSTTVSGSSARKVAKVVAPKMNGWKVG